MDLCKIIFVIELKEMSTWLENISYSLQLEKKFFSEIYTLIQSNLNLCAHVQMKQINMVCPNN